VERVVAERPDYILLDWLMPLMDGSEVVERIGNSDDVAAIPIIVISGQPPPTALPPRVRGWLTKPLTIDELVTELRHHPIAGHGDLSIAGDGDQRRAASGE
jgi:CheY-like chemotaxis protein